MIRLVLALLLLATPAWALDPQRHEAVVISARVWDGYQYKETFLPSTAPVLTLMAGQDSAIAFVRTQEYYWPLSRQVYVDFERQREPVAGVLRIERDGEVVAEVSEAPFAILYPEGAVNGDGSLLWGAAALEGFAAYEQGERDFNRRFVEAQRAQTAYEQALLAAARAQDRRAIAPPPPLPEPSLRLVTRPTPAFRVQLEPGEYRIVLLQDGREVPDTRRQLRVVASEGGAALVADIIPEERWTRPLAANGEAARIYARAGSTFYLTLAEATRFDERDYLAIVSPQAPAVEGRDLWIRRRPQEAATLQVLAGGRTSDVTAVPLKVEQTSTSGFGYVVRTAKAGETPDLKAYTIAVPTDAGTRLQLAIPQRTFVRNVVSVGPRNALLGIVLALLPAAVGIALLVVGVATHRQLRHDPSGQGTSP